jgi:hypothetical protein
MSDNREPDSNGNPWLKSLLVWGGSSSRCYSW